MTNLRPPNMRRTRWSDLLVICVIIGVAAYVLARVGYDSLPPLSYGVPVPIAVLGLIEIAAARRVRAAVRHDPRSRPLHAISVARLVALGKASSLVGAGVAGAALGLLGELFRFVGVARAVGHDVQVTVLLLGAALLLIAAGMLLERAGVDPSSDERREK
jgi:hypothetical protein